MTTWPRMFTNVDERPPRCWHQFASDEDEGLFHWPQIGIVEPSRHSLKYCECNFAELTPADLPESHRPKPAPDDAPQTCSHGRRGGPHNPNCPYCRADGYSSVHEPAPLPPGIVIPPDPKRPCPRYFCINDAVNGGVYDSRHFDYWRLSTQDGDFERFSTNGTRIAAEDSLGTPTVGGILSGLFVEITNPHPPQPEPAPEPVKGVTWADCVKAGDAAWAYSWVTPPAEASSEGFTRRIAAALGVTPEDE